MTNVKEKRYFMACDFNSLNNESNHVILTRLRSYREGSLAN